MIRALFHYKAQCGKSRLGLRVPFTGFRWLSPIVCLADELLTFATLFPSLLCEYTVFLLPYFCCKDWILHSFDRIFYSLIPCRLAFSICDVVYSFNLSFNMAIPLSKAESRYTVLDERDNGSFDIENDSDTTLGSTPKRSRRDMQLEHGTSNMEYVLCWFRWASIIALQTVILFFLLWKSSDPATTDDGGWFPAKTETGGDINGLYIPSESSRSTARGRC